MMFTFILKEVKIKVKTRAVHKISSCQSYAIIRQEIVEVGNSFGSIFPFFPLEVVGGLAHSSWGKSPDPALVKALADTLFRQKELFSRGRRSQLSYLFRIPCFFLYGSEGDWGAGGGGGGGIKWDVSSGGDS